MCLFQKCFEELPIEHRDQYRLLANGKMLDLCFKCVYNYLLKYFVRAALKSLSDNSTTDIFVLVTVSCLFSFNLSFSWFLVWWMILVFLLLYPGHLGYYVKGIWIIFKSFVLAGLFWNCTIMERRLPYYCKEGVKVQALNLVSTSLWWHYHSREKSGSPLPWGWDGNLGCRLSPC